MGGEYQEHVFTAKDETDLAVQYTQYQEQQAWEFGHGGYTGTFYEKEDGLIFHSGRWELEDARDHCWEKNEKWGRAEAYELLPDEDGNRRWYVGGWCSC